MNPTILYVLQLHLTDTEAGEIMALCPGSTSAMHSIRFLLGYESATILCPRRWHQDEDKVAIIKEPLLRWCAAYLTTARHTKDRALDPALNFHMRNGARLDCIYWAADDASRERWDESFGMMCKYEYLLDDVENNNYRYITACDIATTHDFKVRFQPPLVIHIQKEECQNLLQVRGGDSVLNNS